MSKWKRWAADNQVHRPNGTPDRLTEPRADIHALALEACLESFKMNLDKLRTIEKILLRIRKQTYKKLPRSFGARKQAAKTGKQKREEYWSTHGAPIASKLDEGYERLIQQLTATHNEFPRLADATRNQLITLTEESTCDTSPSKHVAIGKLIASWNYLMEQMRTILREGSDFLPEIQDALAAFRKDIDATLAVI